MGEEPRACCHRRPFISSIHDDLDCPKNNIMLPIPKKMIHSLRGFEDEDSDFCCVQSRTQYKLAFLEHMRSCRAEPSISDISSPLPVKAAHAVHLISLFEMNRPKP